MSKDKTVTAKLSPEFQKELMNLGLMCLQNDGDTLEFTIPSEKGYVDVEISFNVRLKE